MKLENQTTFPARILVADLRDQGRAAEAPLVASAPEPFSELPLAYSRAYGGKAEFNFEPVAWPDNPDGIGYYLSRDQAMNQPLPNIEPGNGPFIRTWEDQPA